VFEFVEANQADFPIAVVCRVLGVSKSGYYDWRRRPPSARRLADEVLTERIRGIHGQSRQIYGYRRVTAELVDGQGEYVGKHRVARLMRNVGICGVTRRRFCRTTRRDETARPAPDLLNRDFTATTPDQRWVADLTFPPGPGSCSSRWSSTCSPARWSAARCRRASTPSWSPTPCAWP
jgi:putative transposase